MQKEKDILEELIKKSNQLYANHMSYYGKVLGFKKRYYTQTQSSIDGGDNRELTLTEVNKSNFIG